jgi:hypothetical protein
MDMNRKRFNLLPSSFVIVTAAVAAAAELNWSGKTSALTHKNIF